MRSRRDRRPQFAARHHGRLIVQVQVDVGGRVAIQAHFKDAPVDVERCTEIEIVSELRVVADGDLVAGGRGPAGEAVMEEANLFGPRRPGVDGPGITAGHAHALDGVGDFQRPIARAVGDGPAGVDGREFLVRVGRCHRQARRVGEPHLADLGDPERRKI